MKILIATAFVGAALAFAASAAADTDSIASWGNDTLGGSLGFNGGSTSIAGVTTTVDGINTLDGNLTVSAPGISSRVDQHYSLDGLETEWTVNGLAGRSANDPTEPALRSVTTEVEGYLYYDPSRWATLDAESNYFNADGGSVSIVCDPLCHEQ